MEIVVKEIFVLKDAPGLTVGETGPPDEEPHAQVPVLDEVRNPDFKFCQFPRGKNTKGSLFL